MIRIFIIKSPTATTSPNFPLKGIAGSTGRLDVICRSLLASLKTRYGIRRSTLFYGILGGPPNPPLTIFVDGRVVENLPDNEVEVARTIRELMLAYMGRSQYKCKGWSIHRWDLRKVLENITKSMKCMLIYLREGEQDIRRIIKEYVKDKSFEALVFTLGSHVDLDKEDEDVLEEYRAIRVSIGPKSYLSSHVITFVHFILDTYNL